MYTDKGSKWYLYPPCSQTHETPARGKKKKEHPWQPKRRKPKESVNRHPILYVAELM